MSKTQKNAKRGAVGANGNGNGRRRPDEVDEAEFFLVPLLATDPLPYLFDSDGNAVNVDGDVIENGNGTPEAIRKLQEELRPHRD